jgi:hypothetical protein
MNPSPSPIPTRLPAAPPPQGPSSLLACFLDILADWEAIFPQSRTHLRAVRQALGTLAGAQELFHIRGSDRVIPSRRECGSGDVELT